MRSLLFLAVLACASALAAAAPLPSNAALCPSMPVQLELHQSPIYPGRYSLVFAAIAPYKDLDFVDIHYRVNNEDSINHRVLTHAALTPDNVKAKQALVDAIDMQPGDVLRAYATYAAAGSYACDTPIHTFNAPEPESREREFFGGAPLHTNAVIRRVSTPYATRTTIATRRPVYRRDADVDVNFWAQAVEEQTALKEQQIPGACPSIALEHDIVKIAGMDNAYVLTFENSNPKKQLHYVDLHLSTSQDGGWDNLRLASDMQLTLAHKVMQPGVVILPGQALKWYWSYRTTDAATGQVVDCTTDINIIRPEQVNKEISIQNLHAAAMWQ